MLDTARHSRKRFPDGGAFRVEIPSVEGPRPLLAVLEEAQRYSVAIHRVSQGSGVSMLDDAEITDMVQGCQADGIELCLFLGPRGTWDIGPTPPPGVGTGPRVRGWDQLRYSVDDAHRAVGLGVRCLLVSDEGVLWTLHNQRKNGELPPDLRLKVSGLIGPSNPAAFAILEGLGADSINVPGDLSVPHLAEIRAVGDAAMDIYIESPDSVGGFVRHHEATEIVSVAAPVYLKFGLRNAPEIYPTGLHIEDVAVASARERVRRAHLVLAAMYRTGAIDSMSPPDRSGAMPRPQRFVAEFQDAGKEMAAETSEAAAR